MELALSILLPFVGGYVAAIYTWAKLTQWVRGAEAEAASLRAKADALLAKVNVKI